MPDLISLTSGLSKPELLCILNMFIYFKNICLFIPYAPHTYTHKTKELS
jgi:hypothetical protein